MVSVARLLSISLAILLLACAVSGQQPKRKSEPYIAPLLPAEQAWNVTLSASGPGNLAINEFLAANASIAPADENLEFADWIEIQNNGAVAVNLLGWSLSTDADEPNQWIFPSRTVAANSRRSGSASR